MTREQDQHESEHFDFNDRYGIKPAQVWKRYAIAFGIAGGAWLPWAGLYQSTPVLRSELISFTTDDPRKPVIRVLIERGDEAGLQDAIEYMASHIHSYDKSALRTYALQRFSNEAVAAAFVELYRSAGK